MEDETRNIYHLRVAELAKNADTSEVQTAQIALELARGAAKKGDPDPRRACRTSHIGHYLLAEGLPLLSDRLRATPQRWNAFAALSDATMRISTSSASSSFLSLCWSQSWRLWFRTMPSGRSWERCCSPFCRLRREAWILSTISLRRSSDSIAPQAGSPQRHSG